MNYFLTIDDSLRSFRTRAKDVKAAINAAKKYKLDGYDQSIVMIDKKTRERKTLAREVRGEWIVY